MGGGVCLYSNKWWDFNRKENVYNSYFQHNFFGFWKGQGGEEAHVYNFYYKYKIKKIINIKITNFGDKDNNNSKKYKHTNNDFGYNCTAKEVLPCTKVLSHPGNVQDIHCNSHMLEKQ